MQYEIITDLQLCLAVTSSSDLKSELVIRFWQPAFIVIFNVFVESVDA